MLLNFINKARFQKYIIFFLLIMDTVARGLHDKEEFFYGLRTD